MWEHGVWVDVSASMMQSCVVCQACGEDHFLDNGSCKPCSKITCTKTQWRSSSCGATTNQECSECRECPSGTYKTVDCTATENTLCGEITIIGECDSCNEPIISATTIVEQEDAFTAGLTGGIIGVLAASALVVIGFIVF